jgi:hypothetical protein
MINGWRMRKDSSVSPQTIRIRWFD